MDVKIEIDGHEIKVLDGPYFVSGRVTNEAIEFAKTIISDLDAYKKKTADRLPSLYNETWLDDDIGELTVSD